MDTAQAVVIGEKVYMGGGVTEEIEDSYHVFQYNISLNEWSHLPKHPVHRFAMTQFMGSLITVGGEGAVGGVDITGKVYCFKEESQEWVEPIVSKQDLQKAFKDYIKPPSIIEKVQKLSEFLQEYGNALRTHKEPPKSTDPSFTPILNALSTDWEARLDEVTAMLVTTEACVEFPQHTIKKMIALQDDKRTILLDLVRFGLRTTAHDKFLSLCLVST